jgi:hypothetical protein
MRLILVASMIVGSSFSAKAEPRETVASFLSLWRNPDYGTLGPADVMSAQDCKDKFIARATSFSRLEGRRRDSRIPNLNAPTYRSAAIVAAAVEVCLAAKGAEGVHVAPTRERLGNPLLR